MNRPIDNVAAEAQDADADTPCCCPCTGLMDYVAAQNNPCPAICDTSKLQPVSQEGASTTDVLSAVKVTLDIMLGAITEVPLIGELAAGAQMLMDTGYSLWTAWDSVANPQLSIKNSLHNDMVQLQVGALAT